MRYYDEDELVGAFSSMSVGRGRGKARVNAAGSSSRRAPPQQGPCACVSNQTVRRRLGVEGDPSVDIDHIYEKHRAKVRGLYADIEVNKELAPSTMNRRWGQLYRHGKYELVEAEKRAYYGNARYKEAMEGVRYCNKTYDYRRR